MSGPSNIQQVVPFLSVADIEASVRYYVDGLGFRMTRNWTPEGKLRWCWLELGRSAVMLQESSPGGAGGGGQGSLRAGGVELYFICDDALAIYREVTARGIKVERPFVGNGMWVASLTDPDGHRLHFESETGEPEETRLSEGPDRAPDC